MAPHQEAMDRRGLPRNPDIAAPDFPIFDQTAGNELRGVDCCRETNPLSGKNNGRVDPNHLTAGRNERAAGVSWIQSSIRLYNVVNKPAGLGAQRTPESTDDSRGDRRLKPVWIADRYDELSDPDSQRVAKGSRNQVGRCNPDHGKIRIRVVADVVRLTAQAIGEDDLDRGRAMNDMTVRQNEPVRRKYEAGTGSTPSRGMMDFDFDDGGANTLSRRDYGFRVGIEQRRIGDHASELMPQTELCKCSRLRLAF